jgi:hypothetical protein
MSSATVKIDSDTYATLKEVAVKSGEPMIAVIAKAVEAYRRRVLLETLNADFAALRADPAAWKAELEEREAWDATLADDLEDD